MIGNWNYGTGRRKSSVARVFIKRGEGQIVVWDTRSGRALSAVFDRHGFGFVKLSATREEIFRATRIDPDDAWVQWALASIARTSGKKPALLPNLGGSLPNDIFTDILGLKTIWVPHSYPGCSQHAPNEHLPPAVLREGLQVMTGLYWDLGAGDTPPLSRRTNV